MKKSTDNEQTQKKKLINILSVTGSVLMTVLIFGILIFLAVFLENKWSSFLIIAISVCILWYIKLFRKPSLLKRTLLWIATIVTSIIAVVFCRPVLSVSVAGNLVNNTFKYVNHKSLQDTGHSLLYESLTKQAIPYEFGIWKAPEGYTNKEVILSNSKGYLLSYEKGSREKVVYQLHGGAYVGTFTDTYNNMALKYSECYDNSDVFSLDYRTAPDNPYPCALEDAVEGYNWLLNNGYKAENIIITGDSAGGGLALSTTMYLRDYGMELPKLLIIVSPWTDLSASGDSYKTNILSDALFGSINAETAPEYPVPIIYAEGNDLTDPYISPAYGNYEGMPPMLIQTGDTELLLSDSTTVVSKAEAAGAEVRYIEYPGMFHTFCVVIPQLPESKDAFNEIKSFISDYSNIE